MKTSFSEWVRHSGEMPLPPLFEVAGWLIWKIMNSQPTVYYSDLILFLRDKLSRTEYKDTWCAYSRWDEWDGAMAYGYYGA